MRSWTFPDATSISSARAQHHILPISVEEANCFGSFVEEEMNHPSLLSEIWIPRQGVRSRCFYQVSHWAAGTHAFEAWKRRRNTAAQTLRQIWFERKFVRTILLGLAPSLTAAPALAQSGPPRGGGGSGGGGGPPGGGRPGGHPPRAMRRVKREQPDKLVTSMFQIAERDGDGLVTLDELRMVINERREARIRARFERIDRDRDRSISATELLAWQRSLGSVASSEHQPVAEIGGPVSEAIAPELGGDQRDAALARLIDPLSAMTVADANVNYDTGLSLEELLAHERKRFDRADANHDGERADNGGAAKPRSGA